MTCHPCIRTVFLYLILAAGAPSGWADYKDDIGLTALLMELGGSAPTGAGISVSQVEFAFDGSNYVAITSEPELAGKTFTPKSGISGGSGSSHATGVARSYCGSDTGVAPGIAEIDAYEVNGWLTSDFLNMGGNAPDPENRRIQNHSWVADYDNQSLNQEAVRRLDFAIQEDGFVAIVGLNNDTATAVPPLLAHTYNGIAVGNDNGFHSSGGTTFDVAGRIKPEIVTPSGIVPGAVSYSIGTVSGAAALLLETADGSGSLVNARNNSEVIKALLLAGASKTGLSGGWTRTPTQPLDVVYGAGRLNVQKSYHLLVAGEQAASGSSTVSDRGWDFASAGGSPARYFFDVLAGQVLTNFSVILTWNREVSDGPGPGFNPQVDMADMGLGLYTASGFTTNALLDSSVSAVDNVEHVFINFLGPGRYALEVTSDTSGWDYALAWGGMSLAEILTTANPSAWGSVSPASGYYALGINLSFLATPAQYFLFDQWSGDLSGTTNPVAVTVNSSVTVTAQFVEQVTTNYPTPYWWLAQYGYTSNQETVVTNLGANGYPLWQSYTAGLVPTNPASQLRFTSQTLLNETNLLLTWDTVTGRVYTVWNSTNAADNFTTLPGAVDLPATIQSFTNPIPPASPQEFFLLEVEKP